MIYLLWTSPVLIPFPECFSRSLLSTKTLHLRPRLYRPGTATECEELAVGLTMMPALGELYLLNLPNFNIPKTLRRFSFTAPRGHLPDAEFLARLYQLDALQDLRLSFTAGDTLVDESKIPFSLTNSSKSTGPWLPQLRILQVTISRNSTFLNIFCSQILRACLSLEEVKLFGVGFTNDDILSIATRSLRRISLCGSFNIFDEKLQWSSFCSLFERTPQISEVNLDFELGLSPLTYENIESISTSCPRLEGIYLETREMSEEDIDVVKNEGSAAYLLDWLYCRSSPANDLIIERLLIVFLLDLCSNVIKDS